MRKLPIKNILAVVGLGAINLTLIKTAFSTNISFKEAKAAQNPFGYDMRLKDLGRFTETDRKKLKSRLKSRVQHLKELKDPAKVFDVLIIGGGSTGAGVLFECSAQGLYCALVDKGDFASEASSRSAKILHGRTHHPIDPSTFGARPNILRPIKWLKQLMENIDERNYQLNAAPYMNRLVNLVIPCTNIFQLGYYYIGACIYHFLCFYNWCFEDYTYKLSRPCMLSREKMKEIFPALKGNYYGVQFSEGQTQDARLVLQTLLTSTVDNYLLGSKGAALGNYIEFVDLVKDKNGICVGAKLRDTLEHQEFTVKAKVVVNCAGAFSDQIRMKDRADVEKRVVAVRETYLTLPPRYTKSATGLVIPSKMLKNGKNKPSLCLMPYKGYTLVGKTAQRCDITAQPLPSNEDIKEITDNLQKYFMGDVGAERITAWSGIRPMFVAKNEFSEGIIGDVLLKVKAALSKLRRKKAESEVYLTHPEVEISPSGLLTVLGGNYTGTRKKGEIAIEAILKTCPSLSMLKKESATKSARFIGGYTNRTLDGTEITPNEFLDSYARYLHEHYGLDWDVCNHLLQQYGTVSVQVAQMGKDASLNEKIHEEIPVLKVQVVYAIKKELAVHVKDVVFRRLGVGFTDKALAQEVIPLVANVMATELNWSSKQKEEEIAIAKNSIDSLMQLFIPNIM
eukprot:TRINITY_DN64682_c1_g1_i1.p1 TRINITY_DN64682_c1_g1~~TRINITY_DN64682_c1_g1_i1.p1  ORF type:complete len:710 (-),score=54.76 TRINITY_DN64682_c1_g1_i1:5774-7810(-)